MSIILQGYGVTTPTPTPTPTPGADTLIRLRYSTGATLDTQIEGGAGVWDGSDYVDFASGDWADYATATPETPSGSGRYVCQFPITSPPGNYAWSIYLRSGASPAVGDVCVGEGSGYWDGTTFGGTSKVTDGSTSGSGSVSINQDYPTAGNLRFQAAGGQGIGGASVRAYLADEWAANPATATVRGQAYTLDTGLWTNVIALDPGDYQIVFTAESYETAVVALTVE